MKTRLLLLALAIALPSWVALILLLGNLDLQRSVSRGLFLPLERPAVFVAIVLIALAAGFLGARIARVSASDLVPLAIALAAVNLGGAVAATYVVDELELPTTPIVFVVLSGYGALFLGGLAGAWLAGRRPLDR